MSELLKELERAFVCVSVLGSGGEWELRTNLGEKRSEDTLMKDNCCGLEVHAGVCW